MGVVQSLTAERMLDIEAASVVHGEVIGDNLWLTRHDGSQFDAGNVRGASQFANRVQNSRFLVNQRLFDYVDLESSTLQRGPDRWAAIANGTLGQVPATFSLENEVLGILPESATNYLRLNTSMLPNIFPSYAYIQQKIEDVRTLSGKTVTLSFWAKCNVETQQQISVLIKQNFGSGSPSGAVTVSAGYATLTQNWNRHVISFAMPSVAGKQIVGSTNHLDLRFYVADGGGHPDSPNIGLPIQNDIFDFWGVQLEEGPVATPLRIFDYAAELAACQRHYFVVRPSQDAPYRLWTAMVTAATQAIAWVPFPVPMRKVPTVTFSALAPLRVDGNDLYNFTSITVMNNADPVAVLGVEGVSIRGNGSSGATNLAVGNATIFVINGMDGFVAFSAEF